MVPKWCLGRSSIFATGRCLMGSKRTPGRIQGEPRRSQKGSKKGSKSSPHGWDFDYPESPIRGGGQMGSQWTPGRIQGEPTRSQQGFKKGPKWSPHGWDFDSLCGPHGHGQLQVWLQCFQQRAGDEWVHSLSLWLAIHQSEKHIKN